MAGFLDKNIRINDFILTDYGKEKLSKGELRFKYYTFSDDDIDYDPYISNSASLSDSALTSSKEEQIENSLTRESVVGIKGGTNNSSEDHTNIRNILFTMPQGQKILPEFKFTPDVLSGSIEVQQQKIQDKFVNVDENNNVINDFGTVDRGFDSFVSSKFLIDCNIENYFDDIVLDGFEIEIFESGSDGLREITHRRDGRNTVSYSGDLKLYGDDLIELFLSREED